MSGDFGVFGTNAKGIAGMVDEDRSDQLGRIDPARVIAGTSRPP